LNPRTLPEAQPGTARQRLADSRVLIVGVGALGCPAALHLAAAGIGTLVLIDPDRVELSNLHRQILHRTSGIGTRKVASAAARIGARFPEVRVETHATALSPDNLPRLFGAADFIVDATDGIGAKFLINDGAVRLRRPFSHAGVLGFLGQTMTVLPGRSACCRCLFPEPPPAGEIPSCQEAGVVGGIGGLIGALQAAEAIKYLTGDGDLLTDRLLTYDGLSGRWRHVQLTRNPRCPVCAATSPSDGSNADPPASRAALAATGRAR
jgi:molybdopterin-synthase adenylyltransferase